MKNILFWVKNNPNRTMFLIPILLVAGISISHVVSFYSLSNPINWAIYLSIAIEVGAITALIAATNKIKGGIWFMFGLVTFIQMIGNIFYSFKEIDENGELFKSWVELTGPIWELMGTEQTDLVGLKRWLAFLEGGLLPIISLTSLHFFVKYEENNPITNEVKLNTKNDYRRTPKDKKINTKKIWGMVNKLKKEGKLPPDQTSEELIDEPTALAFTPTEQTKDIVKEKDVVVIDEMVEDNKGYDDDDFFDKQPIFVNKNEDNDKKEKDSKGQLIENAIKKYKESKTNISRID